MRTRVSIVRRIAAAAVAAFALWGCQGDPVDVEPGYALAGDSHAERIQDWSFTDAVQEIFIETEAWYGMPHSVTIWCATVDGKLYVGSYGDGKKAWERNVSKHPEARVKIDGVLYDVSVVPVVDEQLSRQIDVAFKTKYTMADVFGDEVPEWWFYSVESVQ